MVGSLLSVLRKFCTLSKVVPCGSRVLRENYVAGQPRRLCYGFAPVPSGRT